MSAIPAEIAKLSVAERIQLVEDLWDSIAAESENALVLTDAQMAALRRRLDAHRQDPGSALPWDIVRAELLNPKK